MKLLGVVGARPNFVKMAPVMRALLERGADAFLVDTGQHFDPEMSQLFLTELGLPEPRVQLGVGALSPWSQAGRIVEGLGDVIASERPEWVLVPGDVNGSLAAAVAASRCGARLAHLESGLRSFDRRMPEERSRIAVDHLADRLFVTERGAQDNLRREGIPEARLRFVGNTMVDTLLASRPRAAARDPLARLLLPETEDFILLTLHQPESVDQPERLAALLDIAWHAVSRAPVVFPVHPRTRRRLAEFGLEQAFAEVERLHMLEPLGYLDFLALLLRARVVMTDSGGIQAETTALGVPCLTLRAASEHPVTCSVGTNRVVGSEPLKVGAALDEIWERPPTGARPEGWDGRAAERVADDLLKG
jgi:UDP-N-acetylglucosamine 2-epimerase (non-hydrolysing)